MTTDQGEPRMKMATSALDGLLDQLAEVDALLLEPQDMYNTCLLGTAQRGDGMLVAAYDSAQILAALQLVNHWDYDEAREYFDYNILGSFVGAGTPIFIDLMLRGDD